MTGHTWAILAVFLLYLAFMVVVGALFYRRSESVSDYFLGDRKLGKWVTALSAQASDMSGWLLLGLPGAAYVSGLSSSWIAIGLIAGTYLNWRIVAKRLRNYTGASESIITLSDYLEYRFRDRTRSLRIISALFILVFFVLYVSSGVVAGGKLFSTVFPFPYSIALVVTALVVVSYTFLGGFNAVCWTDFIQGTLMFFAILIVPAVALMAVGGPGAVAATLSDAEPDFFRLIHMNQGATGVAVFVGVVSSLAWGLGYFGQPHILVRFMAIRSADNVRDARIIAMVWVVLALIGAVAVGMIGRAYLPEVLEGPDTERVFILTVDRMFPALVGGVLLAAILAAIMSTADSQLLVATSAITEDFYKGLLRRDAAERELVWASRLTVVGVAVVALALAFSAERSVLKLVALAWGGFGASFGPTLILSLFWKRMTWQGAVAGIVVGGLTVLGWHRLEGGLFDLYEIVPGFAFSSAAIVIASLASAPPSAEILDEFDTIA